MKTQIEQHIITQDTYDNNLGVAIDTYIGDCKAQQKSPNTIRNYQLSLKKFLDYCESQSIQTVNQVTSQTLYRYVNYLDGLGRNRGGILTVLRPVRAFFNWYFWMNDLDKRGSPFSKFKMPKKEDVILDPVTEEEIEALLSTCKGDDFISMRDRAIIMTLADTGLRGSELCAIESQNVNYLKMQILVTDTKGNKPRYVFVSRNTKLAIHRYMTHHAKSGKWVFTNRLGEKLTFHALRQMILARTKTAGINNRIKVHGFRRYFTLKAINNGMSLLEVARILGHKDLSLLMKYAKQSPDDLSVAFRKVFEKDR